ncbi:antibiotic biosynthesis monooxygenase family protein [Saccharibacillus kuerlensis]|uniref:Antibiotic biosynthesis monooxygenase n=1 Tax=Saccharibacillus kuerlensis TaxID=459527 RepID=A0ABQ2KR86_9BACL|nr:antibiotic biosynthesis monooxygenase [Saccharibacillus kuerlensis]GGN90977.1 antibiotic biosynthesis monooxygenase [Saccharibacillus kuerlensis]
MFVVMRTITVKEGTSGLVVERFSQPGIVEEQPGFVDIQVLVKEVRRGEEEVVVQIRWESKEAWKNWEKSDAHIQGHRNSRGQQPPDHVLSTSHAAYELKTLKLPRNAENRV